MTRRELERMTQALADCKLSDGEFEQLQEELRANPESRKFFRQSMEVETLLVEAMAQRVGIGGTRDRVEDILHRRRRRDMTRALMATAAILVLAAVVMTLVVIVRPEPPALTGKAVPGTQWRVEGKSPAPDGKEIKVMEGSKVNLISGSVQLKLDSGMVMLLRGPAEVSFPKLERPVLKRGWLWIDSGKSEGPIEVETPHQRIRDIGTRFGVRVRDDGLAEVHLLEGVIEVVSKRRDREPLTMKTVRKGFLIPASGQPAELPLAPDPFPGLPDLLASAPNYRTTVLSQGPAGYWRLDEQTGRELANEVPEGIIGRWGNEVSPGKAGVGRDDGFNGFPAGNRSVFLSGDPLTSILINLDLPGGVSREEGGVSFWIRRAPKGLREEILWLAGENPDQTKLIPRKALIYTRLSAAGQIEFLIENGEFDIQLSSTFSVANNQWHHIAASWGPSAVELYVDGRRISRVDDYGELQQGIARGRYVRFGKPSEDLIEQQNESFTGQVDEIALWTRPLSSSEIAHQFREARGAAEESLEEASKINPMQERSKIDE